MTEPTMTPAELLQDKQNFAFGMVDREHARAFNRLSGGATAEERDTWQPKAKAATAYLAGTATAAQTAMIDAEATEIAVPGAALSTVVTAKNVAYHIVMGKIGGIKGRYKGMIATAADSAAIETILSNLTADFAAVEV